MNELLEISREQKNEEAATPIKEAAPEKQNTKAQNNAKKKNSSFFKNVKFFFTCKRNICKICFAVV